MLTPQKLGCCVPSPPTHPGLEISGPWCGKFEKELAGRADRTARLREAELFKECSEHPGGMSTTHPRGPLGIQLSPSLAGSQPLGAPRGRRSDARGSGAGRGGWLPFTPGAWVPSWGLRAELAGPHRLLGSLCLINGAGDVWGARGGMPGAWGPGQLLPARLPAPCPQPLATPLPDVGNQSQLGQRWKVGNFAEYILLPGSGPPSQCTPHYKEFSPFCPVDLLLSCVLTP